MKVFKILTLVILAMPISLSAFAYTGDCSDVASYTTGCSFQSGTGFGRAILYLNDDTRTNLNDLIVYVDGFTSGVDVLPDASLSTAIIDQLKDGKNDVLVISFGAFSVQSVQESGNALIEVFKDINAIKSNALNKSTIIGFSMGGLVSRYALLKSEYTGIDHGMSTYVSLDSPHKGAQSPVGLQYLLFATKNQLENLHADLSSSGLISKVADDELEALEAAGGLLTEQFNGLLNNDASKQMMIFNVLDQNQVLKNQLFDEINLMGGMPRKTRNIGIANGTLNFSNTLAYNDGSTVGSIEGTTYSTIDINVSEELVDNLMEYSGQYGAYSSNVLGNNVARVSTRLPVKVEIKGEYLKCRKKYKWGIPYPSCDWDYGVIASYTDQKHEFDITYPSPINFDADQWPGSVSAIYGNVIDPFVSILSELDFSSDMNFVSSASSFIPTVSALDVEGFNPLDQNGLSLSLFTQSYIEANSSFDRVVFSTSQNLNHSDHSLLFRADIEDEILDNRDDNWLIPVITSMLL